MSALLSFCHCQLPNGPLPLCLPRIAENFSIAIIVWDYFSFRRLDTALAVKGNTKAIGNLHWQTLLLLIRPAHFRTAPKNCIPNENWCSWVFTIQHSTFPTKTPTWIGMLSPYFNPSANPLSQLPFSTFSLIEMLVFWLPHFAAYFRVVFGRVIFGHSFAYFAFYVTHTVTVNTPSLSVPEPKLESRKE